MNSSSIPLSVTLVLIAVSPPDLVIAQPAKPELRVMKATHSNRPLQLDGKLDEPVWKKATVYDLELAGDKAREGRTLGEQGQVRLAWDSDNLYVGIDWDDRDVIAKGTKDHEFHFKLGDLCEIFLRHEDQDRYWELYGTPAQKKSCFWFKKRRGKIQTDRNFGLRVATEVDGTLNEVEDQDRGWSAELAVSKKDLTRHGAPFGPDSSWRILVARYNYSTERGSRRPELSMTPQLSRTNYHLLEEHARLEFVR